MKKNKNKIGSFFKSKFVYMTVKLIKFFIFCNNEIHSSKTFFRHNSPTSLCEGPREKSYEEFNKFLDISRFRDERVGPRRK